jgi:hypothetical protein
LSSPFPSLHGGGEQLLGVEDGDQLTPTLNDAAEDARALCATASERLNFVGEDFVYAQSVINSERKLLVAAQRDDESRARRPLLRGWLAEKLERIKHGQHQAAYADHAEHSHGRAWQRRRLQPLCHAARFIRKHAEQPRARAHYQQLAPLTLLLYGIIR